MTKLLKIVRLGAVASCIALCATTPCLAAARSFAIAPQDLAGALKAFADQSGSQIIAASSLITGKSSSGVTGAFADNVALDRILNGSGLHADKVGPAFVVRSNGPRVSNGDPTPDTDIVVTGSRIKGAPPASPVITLTNRQIVDSGLSTIDQALRTLPQNFSGGQNPGVTLGPQSANPSNANFSNGSAIDLRGLGPDATLTLLNGHRLAYDGNAEGIDISTIPLPALDRVEIVADGASAIYGSDAVAGVANVILKKDYDGVSAIARIGGATDGGDFQQQYGIVGGRRWSSGGFIVTYNYVHDTAIQGDQRDYLSYLDKPDTLLPAITSHSAIVSGHQDLSNNLTFAIDGLFSQRLSDSFLGVPNATSTIHVRSQSYEVTPSLTAHLGLWSLAVTGTYSRDRGQNYGTEHFAGSTDVSLDDYCLCNGLKTAEVTAEGPLLTLPGGSARIAVGAGYRENDFDDVSYDAGTTQRYRRRAAYGYGELYLPLLGPDQDLPLLHRLSLTGAIRHEDYKVLGTITTPKFGIIYEPVDGLDLKASWGRSFKAPLLTEQYSPAYAYLYPLYAVGGTGYPANATALLAYGGSGTLKPERATTWTTTIDLHPVIMPRLHATLSYFHTLYKDRVTLPVDIEAALSNPVYKQFLTYQPSVAAQQAIINRSSIGLLNFSGVAYDPANVVAIVNDYYTNVAVQTIHGVDAQVDYRADLAGGEVDLTGQASWLNSRQRNSVDSASYALSGTVFNAPKFRARAGAIWSRGALTASAFVNTIDGVEDTRQPPVTKGDAMTTFDLALRWRGRIGGGRKDNIEIAVAAQNIANQRPPFLLSTSSDFVNYDSTNYSAIGRFVTLSVTTHW